MKHHANCKQHAIELKIQPKAQGENRKARQPAPAPITYKREPPNRTESVVEIADGKADGAPETEGRRSRRTEPNQLEKLLTERPTEHPRRKAEGAPQTKGPRRKGRRSRQKDPEEKTDGAPETERPTQHPGKGNTAPPRKER